MRAHHLILLIAAGLLAACTRATTEAPLVVSPATVAPGAQYSAAGLVATRTPAPQAKEPASATPELTMTALSVAATEIYVASVRQQATQQARLDAIAEQAAAAQAAANTQATQQAVDASATAVAAASAAEVAEAGARATQAAIRITQASAYALTALPAAATQIAAQAGQAVANAETANRFRIVAVWLQAGAGLAMIGLMVWFLFRMWKAWKSTALDHAREQAMIDGIKAENDAKLAHVRRTLEQAFPIQPAAPSDETINAARHAWEWRTACLALAMYAREFGGWAFDTLGPDGYNVVSRPAWDRITDYLAECGFLAKAPQKRTDWREGVTYESFRDATRVSFPKPFPALRPPVVKPVEGARTAQGAQGAQTAQI